MITFLLAFAGALIGSGIVCSASLVIMWTERQRRR